MNNNPILKNGFIESKFGTGEINISKSFSVNGVVNKSFFIFGILLIGATYSWNNPSYTNLIIGLIGGIVLAVLTMYRPDLAYITSSFYAGFQGLVLGGISSILESIFPGIAFQAVAITLFSFLGLLFAYKFSLIEVTDKFKSVVIMATFSIMIFYLVDIVLTFFGIHFYSNANVSLFSIALNLIIVVVASLNLLIDFDFIYKIKEDGSYSNSMEWYASFGLMVTLIWMYIEILNLLVKMRMFFRDSE